MAMLRRAGCPRRPSAFANDFVVEYWAGVCKGGSCSIVSAAGTLFGYCRVSYRSPALRRGSRDGLGLSRAYEAPCQDRREEHEQRTGQKQGVIAVSKTRDGQYLNLGGGVAWN